MALPRPAAAIVGAEPDPGAGTCETNGRVNAVAYLGNTLYLGGSFDQVEGETRRGLAACNATTGCCCPGTPTPTPAPSSGP